jgi:hypothetical protein
LCRNTIMALEAVRGGSLFLLVRDFQSSPGA